MERFLETLAEAVWRRSLSTPMVYGDASRVRVAEGVVLNDCLLNVVGGSIRIERHAFLGHSVALLTGTHDVRELGMERQRAMPTSGRDISIGEGAWIATRAMVLGPCTIGEHAVVGAGAIVRGDVPPFAIVAGCPAQVVGYVEAAQRS